MTIIAASGCQIARLFRQSSTGHGDARSDTQPKPQRDQSSPFKAGRFDRSEPLIQRNDLEQPAGSSRRRAAAASAALKSP
jgi:ABC-type uncharacterized transport system involved in gliding motility auxiliary subunit